MLLRQLRLLPALLLALLSAASCPREARAWFDAEPDEVPARARGVHVVDGSYVMTVGRLQMNITNWGLIGSRHTVVSSFADSPSGQWPGGTGIEYLWAAGLWVGAKLDETPRVSTGQPEAELRPLPDIRSTIYEARDHRLLRPPGNPGASGLRPPAAGADDDGDGRRDEELLDGLDNDGDGRIDEDFAQIGTQMMACTMFDDTRLAREIYPDHQPLGIRIQQESYAWEAPEYSDHVALKFVVTNEGPADLKDVYIGFYVDCDIGPRRTGTGADDLAGFWEGRARGGDGGFSSLSVAYMHDGAAQGRVPGYIGVMPLGSKVLGYHRFTGNQPFESGGEPLNDAERYHLMTRRIRDIDTAPGQEGDHRFLITTGPVPLLMSGRSVGFVVALVVGDGLEGLLTNCANAHRCWTGEYFNLDNDLSTGRNGRETYTCEEWWPFDPTIRASALFKHDARYMDMSCLTPDLPFSFIVPGDLTIDALGNHCLWVNMDNCEECERQFGRPCTADNRLMLKWNCRNESLPALARPGCTGIQGRESRVPWYVSRNAPPPPALRVVPAAGTVHVFWDDLSEHAPDLVADVPDFESYLVWRADDWDRPFGTSLETGPAMTSWSMIAEYDLVNSFCRDVPYDGGVQTVHLPLGRNTGLEPAVYRPACLDDPRFAGLAEAMQAVVDADTTGSLLARPALRLSDATPVPGLAGLLRWEGHSEVLDTFFLVARRPAAPERGDPGKRAVRFYEHVDREIHDGFLYFYSVTATDHQLDFAQGEIRIVGPGQVGSPSTSFTSVVPGRSAQTVEERRRLGADIYVYPNPATNESLAEFQQMRPNATDPSGVRVVFANLPHSRNRIRIYTLDGDLVADLLHDGSGGVGHLPWNLVSRSGQKIVSGIYLYVVESEDDRFERFTGRFVVIR